MCSCIKYHQHYIQFEKPTTFQCKMTRMNGIKSDYTSKCIYLHDEKKLNERNSTEYCQKCREIYSVFDRSSSSYNVERFADRQKYKYEVHSLQL